MHLECNLIMNIFFFLPPDVFPFFPVRLTLQSLSLTGPTVNLLHFLPKQLRLELCLVFGTSDVWN